LKFLVIQTAFIGDAILATAVLEKIHAFYPEAQIDYLIRKGNEQLFDYHPFIRKLWIWDKKKNKLKNQLDLILQIRKVKYDYVINC
jgi:heptosyltransferase II